MAGGDRYYQLIWTTTKNFGNYRPAYRRGYGLLIWCYFISVVENRN
ncbi:MAG: hypothetical protein LBR79_00105 [Oscillospiraceae bacterium]|nr:hypothetical protein [Oscillospiraceae bacterium]